MSRLIALIATAAILELGVCTTVAISENSSSTDMPANTESISDTAEAEQPAQLIEKNSTDVCSPEKSISKNSADSEEPSSAKTSQPPAGRMLEAKKDTSKEDDSDERDLQAERNARDNAIMSHDDSAPGAKVDPLLYYQAGCKFIKQQKYQLALEAFNKALELNPKYFEASFRKAFVFQLTGYDKYAARRYQDVLKYRPDMDEARLNLAALHRKHKHYSGAEEQLRLVIQHNWSSFEAHYNLANVLVEDNKMDEALKEYKFCLRMRPNDAMVHNNVGVLFLQKNYPDEALQEFRKASQLDPKNSIFAGNINSAQKLIAEKKSKSSTM